MEVQREDQRSAVIVLSPREARTAAAIFERFFPADENGPGATEICGAAEQLVERLRRGEE